MVYGHDVYIIQFIWHNEDFHQFLDWISLREKEKNWTHFMFYPMLNGFYAL